MKVLSYFDVAAQQVATHAVDVIRLDGYFKGSTNDRWLQVHDSAVTPANAAVPLIEWFLPKSAAFLHEFELGLLHLTKGLYIVVSTTEGTLTASTDKMDLSVELEKVEEPSGTSIAGDLTSSVQLRDLWAEAAGPKKLIRLEVDGTGTAADHYIMIFGRVSTNLSDGDRPIAQFFIAADTAQTVANGNPLVFGIDGRDIVQTMLGVNYYGCCVVLSTTSTVLTTTAENFKIKAEYK